MVLGAVYLLIGLAGFAVTGFDDFAAPPVDGTLIIFGVNPLHNIGTLSSGRRGSRAPALTSRPSP